MMLEFLFHFSKIRIDLAFRSEKTKYHKNKKEDFAHRKYSNLVKIQKEKTCFNKKLKKPLQRNGFDVF